MGQLDGKTVVITGAGRGIGAAAAELMASEGAGLMLLARTSAEITALATRLRKAGASAEAMTCDVSKFGQVQAAVGRAREVFGRIDVLVNNAAVIEPIGPLARAEPDAWDEAVDIGFKGMFHGMRAVLPIMRTQGSGHILNMGSGAAHNPMEGWSHYCASKAAALMLMRCAHLENKGRGIRMYSLSPGTVATDMQKKIRASGINPVSQMDASQHAPVEVPAKALLWLCSEAAADLAGQEVSLRDPAMRARIGLG